MVRDRPLLDNPLQHREAAEAPIKVGDCRTRGSRCWRAWSCASHLPQLDGIDRDRSLASRPNPGERRLLVRSTDRLRGRPRRDVRACDWWCPRIPCAGGNNVEWRQQCGAGRGALFPDCRRHIEGQWDGQTTYGSVCRLVWSLPGRTVDGCGWRDVCILGPQRVEGCRYSRSWIYS